MAKQHLGTNEHYTHQANQFIHSNFKLPRNPCLRTYHHTLHRIGTHALTNLSSHKSVLMNASSDLLKLLQQYYNHQHCHSAIITYQHFISSSINRGNNNNSVIGNSLESDKITYYDINAVVTIDDNIQYATRHLTVSIHSWSVTDRIDECRHYTQLLTVQLTDCW